MVLMILHLFRHQIYLIRKFGNVATADLEGYGLVVIHNDLGYPSDSVRNTYQDAYISLFNPDPTQPCIPLSILLPVI